MTITSYAQNAEDVRLARVFGDRDTGFYIDVGAAHPVDDSVTKWFYDRGWRGVNVEPESHFFRLLAEQRPEDVNLNCALSDHRGTMTLFETAHFDGGATLDEALAPHHGATAVLREEVEVRTLAEVCAEHVVGPVDYLKIDVEGHEEAVLRGVDLMAVRPRVLIIEATLPHTTAPSHQSWEPVVLKQDYLFVCFDGINRWYVPKEEAALAEVLAPPVTVLDDYEPRQVGSIREDLQRREAVLGETRAAMQHLQTQLADARLQLSATTEALVRLRAERDAGREELADLRARAAEVDRLIRCARVAKAPARVIRRLTGRR